MSEGLNWRQLAQCKDLLESAPEMFDEYFYPEFYQNQAVTRMAKRFCELCPVRLECLVDAQTTGERDGIRGGLTPRERSRLDIPRQRNGEV